MDSISKSWQEMPGCPQVLCGDFNSPKSSAAYSLLSGALNDAFRSVVAAKLCTAGATSTIHKWQGLSFSEEMGDGTVDLSGEHPREDTRHIDWILWQNGRAVGSTELRPLKMQGGHR